MRARLEHVLSWLREAPRSCLAALRRMDWRTDWRAVGLWIVGVGLLAAIFGPSLLAHIARSLDPYTINDDARQQIYPFFRYEDRELFPNDYIGDYYLACLPIGYRGLYVLGAVVWGAGALSKLVPYLLLFATLAALVVAARKLAGWGGAWLAAAFVLSSGLFLGRMAGGLPRGFGFPVAALALAALVHGRVWWHAAAVWLGAAFYPAAAVPAGLSLALVLLGLPPGDRGDAEGWSLKRRLAFLSGTAAIAALILLPAVLASSQYGAVITPQDVADYPEAGPGGRYFAEDRAPFPGFFRTLPGVLESTLLGAGKPLLPAFRAWLDGSGKSEERLSTVLELLLVFVAFGWAVLIVRTSGARRALCLAVAALLGHTVARSVAPNLYLPQRYVLYPAPILALLMVATAGVGLVRQSLAERFRIRPWLAALVVGLPALLLLGGRGSPNAGLGVRADPDGRLYRFARKLPKNALIAGFPEGVMNNLPYVGERAVLVAWETHQAFHVGYTLEMRKRMNATVDALLASDAEPLRRLQRDFGVTHLMYNRSQLTRLPSYFKPFDRYIQKAAARARDKPRFVDQLESQRVYDDGERVVVALGKL